VTSPTFFFLLSSKKMAGIPVSTWTDFDTESVKLYLPGYMKSVGDLDVVTEQEALGYAPADAPEKDRYAFAVRKYYKFLADKKGMVFVTLHLCN